jgi:adenine-specific DNA-methyltransferase
MNLESQDIKQQKLDEFKNIFPEIFQDETINYNKLKDILDDNIEESKAEHYSFNWNGKKECYKKIKEKTNTTLKVDEDKTIPDGDNVFIEGDNLEVLKLLQTSYHKKVKMIYIDPPYNKDKDFVYSDTWGDSITNYLIQTDQLREEGYTTSKTNSTGRRHTNWLNMIYPRLWLSRNLLKDDGVIFVSIDDDEVHNLRKVMDEIYGEENFVGDIVRKTKSMTADKETGFNFQHEYLLIYAKRIDSLKLYGEEKDFSNYSNPDNDKNDDWVSGDPSAKSGGDSTYFEIINPYTHKSDFPPNGRYWAFSKDTLEKYIQSGKIKFKKEYGNNERGFIFKRYKKELETIYNPVNSLFSIENEFMNQVGTKELKGLFEKEFFDNPKPVNFIKKLVQYTTNEDDIVLDFFAGSGTTAHAVMELNQEDNGNRKYILVQLPEATDEKSEAYKNGYQKISDITKERIKRVIEKLDYKDGFKSYYLDNSNFQVFKELKKRPNDKFEDIVKMLKMSVFNKNIFAQGAKELDIVYEVGLKNGFSLSAKNEEIDLGTYKAIKLYEEDREFYFCFANKVEIDIQEFIPEGVKLICYDKALDDSTKLNLRQNIDLETL